MIKIVDSAVLHLFKVHKPHLFPPTPFFKFGIVRSVMIHEFFF